MDQSLIQALILTSIWLTYLLHRFGRWDTALFLVINGLAAGLFDSFFALVLAVYHFPGRSPQWVVLYLCLGWLCTICTSFFLAEGIVKKDSQSIFERPAWQIPLATAIIGATFDTLIDPLCHKGGLWVWRWHKWPWHGVPLGNFVGWFLLMFEGCRTWLILAKDRQLPPKQRFWSGMRRLPRMYLLPATVGLGLIILVFGG